MSPAPAVGEQASKSPGRSPCSIPGSTGVLPPELWAGMGAQGPEMRAPLTFRVYFRTACDILFLLVQWGRSRGGCGFAQVALDPTAPSTFALSRTYSTPFSIFLCPCCSSFSFFQCDLLLCASGINPFIPPCPRSRAGGSCLGRWVISKVKQHLGFAPRRRLPPSLH